MSINIKSAANSRSNSNLLYTPTKVLRAQNDDDEVILYFQDDVIYFNTFPNSNQQHFTTKLKIK